MSGGKGRAGYCCLECARPSRAARRVVLVAVWVVMVTAALSPSALTSGYDPGERPTRRPGGLWEK